MSLVCLGRETKDEDWGGRGKEMRRRRRRAGGGRRQGEEDKMKGAGGNVKIDTTVKGRGGKRDGRREGVESAFTATSTTLVSNLSLDPLLPTLMTYPAAST